jgi:hypothetical protein
MLVPIWRSYFLLFIGTGRVAEMKYLSISFLALLAAGLAYVPLMAQTTANEMTPEQIIKAFSAKETEFYEA